VFLFSGLKTAFLHGAAQILKFDKTPVLRQSKGKYANANYLLLCIFLEQLRFSGR